MEDNVKFLLVKKSIMHLFRLTILRETFNVVPLYIRYVSLTTIKTHFYIMFTNYKACIYHFRHCSETMTGCYGNKCYGNVPIHL